MICILCCKYDDDNDDSDDKLAKMIITTISQECFRVFSKDEDGCIPADEIK